METYYAILGIPENATVLQIKDGYRREAMKWHPDRFQTPSEKERAEVRFKQIAEAYRCLRDEIARASYDEILAKGRSESGDSESASRGRGASESGQRQEREQPRQNGTDAEQMFFEQMLELAFELAAQGLETERIAEKLVHLGCPVAMARAVATTAVRIRRQRPTSTDETGKPAPTPFTEIGAVSWAEAEPFYRASLEGDRPSPRLIGGNYQRMENRHQWIQAGLGVAAPMIAGFMLVRQLNSDWSGTSVPLFLMVQVSIAAWVAVLIYWIIGAILRSALLPSGFTEEYRVKRILELFRQLHDGATLPLSQRFNFYALVLNGLWLGYRRVYRAALAVTLFAGVMGFALSIANGYLDATASESLSWVAGTGLWIYVGANANNWLFRSTKDRISRSLKTVHRAAALEAVRKSGGVSRSASAAFGVMLVLACVPAMLIEAERVQRRYEQVRIQEAARRDRAESDARSEAAAAAAASTVAQEEQKRRYLVALREIEARYPLLNPDSPAYEENAMRWVADRMNLYRQGGRPSDQALRQAVTDFSQGQGTITRSNPPKQVQRQQQPSSTSDAVDPPLGGSQGQTAGEVICQTWPHACQR